MFEKKKVSHEEKKNGNIASQTKPISLNVPDISGLGVDETQAEEVVEEQEEEQVLEQKKPFISVFRNLFGGAQSQQKTTGGCGCMGG